MSWAIQVEGLSKSYRLGRGHGQKFENFYQVISDKCIGFAEKVTGGRASKYLPPRAQARPGEIQSEHMLLAPHQFEGIPAGHFWALRDVSFRIEEGQRVGIIGRNGSGKSTLLKILSRITRPSTGQFKFRGHLISLLEVGTGFHPDLTGRENIFLNAQINGLSSQKVRRIFDEIVDFSEIGVQIDMPIKRYSSGMYMRLAFSVAAFLESDILVVDEVLAVGDAGFQKKCLKKMLDIGNSGRTLLFVSHDMDAVKKICNSAIEIANGRLVSQSPLENTLEEKNGGKIIVEGAGQQSVATAIADYSHADRLHAERQWGMEDAPRTRSGNFAVASMSLRLTGGGFVDRLTTHQPLDLVIELLNLSAINGCNIRLDIETVTGRMLLSTYKKIPALIVGRVGRYQVVCQIPMPFFNAGLFRLSVSLFDEFDSSDSCYMENVLDLQIDQVDEPSLLHLINPEASLQPEFNWSVQPA